MPGNYFYAENVHKYESIKIINEAFSEFLVVCFTGDMKGIKQHISFIQTKYTLMFSASQSGPPTASFPALTLSMKKYE